MAHSVALKDDGTIWTWGQNYYGQLGDGSSTDKYSAIQVTGLSGLTGATAIAVGNTHTVALKNDGTVWVWGRNSIGQLGDGSTRQRTTPSMVAGLTDIIAIAAGLGHTAALKNDGTVWTWGGNDSGQLGDGCTATRTTPVQVSGLTGIIAIATGFKSTLALKNDGTVWAWGNNNIGQLGDGTITSRTVPTQVAGLTGVTAMASGYLFSVALKNDGTVWAWGGNYCGQLGDGSTTDHYTPAQVAGLSGITAIATGTAHAIALKSDGTSWAWGENSSGQLGDGSNTNRTTPVQVSGLTGVSAVGTGYTHTVAMKNDGTVWAWGSNVDGQLGNGIRENVFSFHSRPSQVTGFIPDTTPPVTTSSVPEGEYPVPQSVTLTANEPAAIYYTLDGNDPTTASAVYSGPIPVTTSATVKFFAMDSALNSETVKTMVYTISDTTPPVTSASVPGGIYATPQTVILTVNEPASTYYTVDGSEPTVGSPVYGPLRITSSTVLKFFARDMAGNVEDIKSVTYTIMSEPLGLSQVAAGNIHAAALRNDSTVWTWGSNGYGQLGDATNTQRTTPVQVQGLTGVIAISTGGSHTAALKNDGTVWTWGWNYAGQLGDGTTTDRNAPVQVTGLTGVTAIAAGDRHTLALKNDGTVWAWGSNLYGQLGDGASGAPLDRAAPYQVVALSNIVNISAGYMHSVALKDDGTVWTWGGNWYGQLGDGTSTPNMYATTTGMVTGLTGITAISAGYWHTVALKNDGTVWAWGLNSSGQLGDGTKTDRATPVQSTGLSGVTAIAAYTHTVALKNDGTVWTWGDNSYGALGVGDEGFSTSRTSPVQVPNLTGFVSIAAGSALTVALKDDSTVWTWGFNGAGQLGDGTSSGYRAFPQKVTGFSSIAATPVTTASLPSGTYANTQLVTLTANKPATIYYTINGVAPTTASSVYTGPISISGSTTLKFFARDSVGNSENSKSRSYAITASTGSADACQQLTLAHIKLRDNGSDSFFARLTDAYAAATGSDNVIVTLPSGQLSESLRFDKGINLIIRGGYDANYGTIICRSIIQGSMIVESGSVTIDGALDLR